MAEDNVKRIHGTREIQQSQRLNEPLFIKGEEKTDSVLENESNFGRFDGLDISGKKEKEENVKKELERRIKKIAQDTTNAEKNNGILRRGFSWVKNNIKLIDKFSNSTNDVIVAQAEELKSLNGENISKIFLETTGFEYNDENIEKFLNGEILTKSEEALKKYKEGQRNFSEFGSDMASTMIATTAFTAAGAFIAALGAPVLLVGAGAIAVAAAVGAGTKVAGNALAANNANEEYDSLTKDLLLGAVNGALAPLTAIGGGKIASKIVTSKLLGGTATKAVTKGAQKVAAEGIEELAERGTQKASTLMTDILNPYGYQYGGSNLIKGIGYSTEFIFDGSIGGAADAAVRTAYDGGTSEDILKSAGQGALFGTVGALGFGWGLKGLGSMAHNWGYNKGIEVNGSRSINDQAIIDAGGNPSKRYHIPQPKDNSGTLYSGLPIMEIARFLGKSPDFKTLDDVAEDYMIHRFYSMKKHVPEQYRDFMNCPDGSANPLDDVELSPQLFVEDILFSGETLSPYDFFEFNKFKRKINKESLNESLENLLSYYEIVTPEIHNKTSANNISDNISAGSKIEDNPTTQKAKEFPTQKANTGKKAKAENFDEEALRKKALEGIKAIKGTQNTTEYLLKDQIFEFYKANDTKMCQDLKEIFNLYCGANKKSGKHIATAFEAEYKAAQGNLDEMKKVVQKFKNLTDEQKFEINKLAEEQVQSKTRKSNKAKQDTNEKGTESASNAQGKNTSETDNDKLKIVDTEGIGDKNADKSKTQNSSTESNGPSRINEQGDIDLFSEAQIRRKFANNADDIIEIRKTVPDFDPYKYTPETLVLLIKYSKNTSNVISLSDLIKIHDILKGKIPEGRLFDENGTIFELIYPDEKVFKQKIKQCIKRKQESMDKIEKLAHKIFELADCNELHELRKYYNDNNIRQINITFTNDKNDLIDFMDIKFKDVTSMNAEQKIKLIRELSVRAFEDVNGKPDVETTFDAKMILNELIKIQEKDIRKKAFNSYKNLYKFLKIDSKKIDNITETKDLDLYTLRRMWPLARYLNNPKFSIFTDIHTRLRFLEKFVLAENPNIVTDAQIVECADKSFERLIKGFELSKDIKVENYIDNDYSAISIEFKNQNNVRTVFGLDLNDKIRTLYSDSVLDFNILPD